MKQVRAGDHVLQNVILYLHLSRRIETLNNLLQGTFEISDSVLGYNRVLPFTNCVTWARDLTSKQEDST